MFEQKCTVCKTDMPPQEDGVHLVDPHGFTHCYCNNCAKEVQEKLALRDRSIKGR